MWLLGRCAALRGEPRHLSLCFPQGDGFGFGHSHSHGRLDLKPRNPGMGQVSKNRHLSSMHGLWSATHASLFCSPPRRRPPSLGQKTEDRILGAAALCCGLCPRMHPLRTQPARAVPTDLRHVHPALSSPQLTASCLAGDVSVAAVCSVFCFCECKQLEPHRKRQRRPGHCRAVVSVAAEN